MSIRTCVLALLLVCGLAGTGLAQPFGPQPNRGPMGPQANNNNQNAGDAAAAALGGMMCIGVAVMIGIGIKVFIIIFIVSDARKRGMDPTLYVILEVFLGLIGLIVYLCSREPLLTERRGRYARDYDGDEDDDDQVRRSRRYRHRDEDDEDRDRRRAWDY
jgi:hypothetical protein